MKIFIGEENSCNLNYQHFPIYEGLEQHFEITDKVEEADTIVIAETCCCTEYNILNTMLYIKSIVDRKKDDAKVYLTGCITRKFKDAPFLNEVEEWLKDNIDYIVPQNNPNSLLKLIDENKYVDRNTNDFGMVKVNPDKIADIYIGNGCLNDCSFCKSTFQKYPLKSADLNEVKEAIDMLDEHHISKINFKATNICQYGLDNYHEHMLPEIISYLDSKENINNVALIGFSFSDAIKNNFDEVLSKSTKVTKLCGSLESGSDRLLSMIRKGFTSEEVIGFVEKIRKKSYKDLRLNIISGFPTETLDDVYRTLDVLKRLEPCAVDVCRYTNSTFVDSSQYAQLTPDQIQEHTRIYSKVLRKRNVDVDIVGPGYKYN